MPAPDAIAPSTGVRTVLRLAALFTFLSVLLGSIVCATESGFDCPSWPGCYPDRATPIADINPWIEFVHRSIAIATGPILLVAAIMAQRSRELPRWVKTLPWLALVTAGAAAAFGMATVLYGIPVWMGVLDMACALTAMALSGVAAVAAGRAGARWKPGSTTAWGGVVALVALHLSGIAVAGPSSLTRCLSWPIPAIVDLDGAPAWQVLRMVLAAVAAGFILAASLHVLRHRPSERRWAWTALALLALELVMGVVILANGLPAEDRYGTSGGLVFASLYAATAVALLRVMLELAIRSSVGRRTFAEPASLPVS